MPKSLIEYGNQGPSVSARFCALNMALLTLCLFLPGCNWLQSRNRPTIEFTRIPHADEGGPIKMEDIEGRVTGQRSGQQIVLYAKAGTWWVQPFSYQALTKIGTDSMWKSSTHLGTEYAALLVEAGYHPSATIGALPVIGGQVVAVATVKGLLAAAPVQKSLQFSGYEWKMRSVSSDRNGAASEYDPANAWTDPKGLLHLRISKKADHWLCSEVALTRSFGYGTYSFTVHDISHLEPAAALSLLTWDEQGAEQNHREMDIEISQWGDPKNKNAGFVIQPYFVPENVSRFIAPPGLITYSLQWKPGQASFQAIREGAMNTQARPFASQVFTAGIPSPGTESAQMNFCNFGYSKVPLQKEAEVVIEKFQYLP
jgi:hypothetical protein